MALRLVLHVTKKYEEDFLLQKKCMRLLTFSDYREHTSPIFKSLKVQKRRFLFCRKNA